MTTRPLVDPEVLPLLEMLPGFSFSTELLPTIRAGFGSVEGQPEPALKGVWHTAPGRDGAPDVPLLVLNPPSANTARPAVLHIHGGGMVIGSATMAEATFPDLVLAHDFVVVSVDYRLAPETPFPGPQEDCYAGLEWLIANAAELGVDPSRIVIMGESAGGGLAAALALMVRDRGGPVLAGQVLIYPMVDHRTGGPDCQWNNPQTGEFVWTRESNMFGWSSLQGGYAADDDRLSWFSPARAADLSGLPQTFISVGTLDLFFDEDLDYARRLAAAAVPVELHVYPGAFHGFNMVKTARVALQAQADVVGAMRRMLGV
jgi:triacylglycerol lipase